MTRLLLIVILFLICSCVANEPLPSYQTKYEKVNVAGVEVVPAAQMSQLWVGMPANDVYEAPRELIQKLDIELVEMKRCKSDGLCCGAGGAQMFKEAEKGNKEINIERTEQAMEVKPDYIATGCPFCNTMMTDGVKFFEKEEKIKVLDIAELIANATDL